MTAVLSHITTVNRQPPMASHLTIAETCLHYDYIIMSGIQNRVNKNFKLKISMYAVIVYIQIKVMGSRSNHL